MPDLMALGQSAGVIFPGSAFTFSQLLATVWSNAWKTRFIGLVPVSSEEISFWHRCNVNLILLS